MRETINMRGPQESVGMYRRNFIRLAHQLIESADKPILPFPGLKPEVYEKIKSEEEEYPGYTRPIDERLERFKNEGMKLVFTKYSDINKPESCNILVMPGLSDLNDTEIIENSLLLQNLSDGDNDIRLIRLISYWEFMKANAASQRR
jgi:hypothetical protein